MHSVKNVTVASLVQNLLLQVVSQGCCVHQSGKSKYSEKLTFSHLNCLFRKISKLMVPMGEQQ